MPHIKDGLTVHKPPTKKSSKKDEISEDKQKAPCEQAEGRTRNDKYKSQKDSEICVDCCRAVLDSQQGLCCYLCGVWHHMACEKVDEEIYKFLCKFANEPSLQWICQKCVGTGRRAITESASMKDSQQLLEDKVADLAISMSSKLDELIKRINSMSTVSQAVCDAHLDNTIESIITKVGKTVMDTQKTVEDKVDKLVVSVEKQKQLDSNCVIGRKTWRSIATVEQKVDKIVAAVEKQKARSRELHDCVQEAVRLELKKDKDEMEEINKRRTNIIIHRLKESPHANVDSRKSFDDEVIIDLLHEINCDDVSVQDIVRLGKFECGSGTPRPVKLVMSSESQKEKVLKSTENLKGKKDRGFDKVFLHQDLTVKQRKKRQLLVQNLKE